jgi:hypothetical protein
MSTLLEAITAFVATYPHATVGHLYDEFGKPVSDTGRCGQNKTYTDLVFHRDGQFVHVQHRNMGTGYQVIRVGEVVPMEVVRVDVEYVPMHASEDDPNGWNHNTGLVHDNEELLRMLARSA